MPFSTFVAKSLQNHVLRGFTFTPYDPMWIALYTADNGLVSSSHVGEVAGGSYARLEIRGATGRSFGGVIQDNTPEYSVNEQDWTFPTATAGWGIITHAALVNHATSGTAAVVYYEALTSPRTILNGGVFQFLAGEFKVQHI